MKAVVNRKREAGHWLPTFRAAAYTAGGGAIVWTLLMILPFQPFSSIPPIIVGGGPGTWLLLGYLLYLVAGFGGLSALTALLSSLGGRGLGGSLGWAMKLGLALYYAGVTVACVLLGFAGYSGGYAYSIQHLPDPSIETILLPYLDPVTLAALAGCAGATLLLLSMSSTKALSAQARAP
jgi:hypothetical protein